MRICIRNGYTIPDGSLWCDTIDLLRHFGKDIRQPKYVCPTDLKALHDKLAAKRQEQLQRERTAEEREQAIKDEKQFLQEKGMFFGLVFADELISVKVIESVEEMILEGKAMHHCVGTYYKRADSLILSATIDGRRIETIEVSLKTLQVVGFAFLLRASAIQASLMALGLSSVQSRGACNANTEYHDRIINLVNNNINLIRQRMKAA